MSIERLREEPSSNEEQPFEEQGVIAFCGATGCCPTVDFTGDNVVIRDDFGGRVQLSRAEWTELKRRFIR